MANCETLFDFVSVQSEFDFEPFESEYDSTTEKETRSEQIEVKPDFDDSIFEEDNLRKTSQEYSENKECNQITEHKYNDINSWLEIKLEPTQDDQNLQNEGINLESCQLFCDQCGFRTKTNYQLKVHKESKHKGIRYNCELCDYSAKRKEQVKFHNEAKHEGVTYSCNTCDYQTTSRHALKMHQEINHEGVKYSCNHCEYKMGRKSLVKIHTEVMHEIVRYSCSDCDASRIQAGGNFLFLSSV